ncbi:MAG: PepSY domain-containing protein [Methylococcales bacterium]|nr:PepSY domain-containing protein [Methylococcales bacterium]
MKPSFNVIILFFLSLTVSFAEPNVAIPALTLDQAINKLTKGTQSKVLKAKTKLISEKPIHSIRILTEKGRLKRVDIDATTGRLVDQSMEK